MRLPEMRASELRDATGRPCVSGRWEIPSVCVLGDEGGRVVSCHGLGTEEFGRECHCLGTTRARGDILGFFSRLESLLVLARIGSCPRRCERKPGWRGPWRQTCHVHSHACAKAGFMAKD